MNLPLEQQVHSMHATYCVAVDFKMPLNFCVRQQWERLAAAGFSLEDLKIVLKRWSFKISKGTDAGVLRLSRLTDPDTFADDLAIAHAESKIRRQRPSTREKALEQLRPTVVEPRTNGVEAQRGRDVALRALEQLRNELDQN